MSKFQSLLAISALIAAMLACNLPSSAQSNQQDPGAILTAAALTVQAEVPANPVVTQPPAASPVPASATPSFTPLPPTAVPPTATTSCDGAQFVTDVTYPDGTTVTAGDGFTKTWRLKNTGTCSWTPSYALVFTGGESMSGPSVQALTGNVNPGQTVDISVALTAPASNGSYTGNWGLRNASGVTFAHFFIQINVGSGGDGGGAFAVTHVTFTTSGGCNGFSATAHITTNKAGSVTGYWQRNDASLPNNFGPINFSTADTKNVSISWTTTASGTHSIYIYIDDPNHQQFGTVSFSCP